jgi:hypothetical protein
MGYNRPIARANPKYMEGLKVLYVNDKMVSVDVVICSDRLNQCDMQIQETTTLNTNVVGANGLDTGILESNCLYGLYIIDSSKNSPSGALLLSKLANGGSILDPSALEHVPLMPPDYDCYRLRSFVHTYSDFGQAKIYKFFTIYDGSFIRNVFNEPVAVAFNLSSTNWANLNLLPWVPNLEADVNFKFTTFTQNQGEFSVLKLRNADPISEGYTIQGYPVAGINPYVTISGVEVSSTYSDGSWGISYRVNKVFGSTTNLNVVVVADYAVNM